MILRLVRTAALMGLLSLGFVESVAGQSSAAEYVKARYIVTFAGFAELIADDPERTEGDFVFCTFGDTDVYEYLEDAVPEQVRERDVRLERRSSVPGLESCDVLFIAVDEEPNLPAIFTRLNNRPTLTVSDIPGFTEVGGMIELFRRGRNIRFSVNPGVAQRHGLRISSRLLRVAEFVVSDEGMALPEVRP